VFSRAAFGRYVDRVVQDIARARETAEQMGGQFERAVDSIYLGGGTPTLLASPEIERLFVTISQNLDVQPGAEITVECAPGTLSPAMLETLLGCGVNRVSLGVQSFVDKEAQSVGRLHNRAVVLDDIARLRAAGIANINLDLIAGLPHQTAASWEFSLAETIASGVPHASVYLLEVDEDSRLGRELIAGGTRYHAHFVPDEEAVADFYTAACEQLERAGVRQYEISNFARKGCESRHNLKYWTRQPYLGFGVDAHSMLPATPDRPEENREGHPRKQDREGHPRKQDREGHDFSRTGQSPSDPGFSPWGEPLQAVRFATPDSLEEYVAGAPLQRTPLSRRAALEETFFLGLRLSRGVDLGQVEVEFGSEALAALRPVIAELASLELLHREDNRIRLTPRGRLLSNEVFERFLTVETRLAAS
jgi:oxygen-independent coproporphyrinogen-3 oxidase